LGGGRRQRRNVPYIMHQLPQERRNSVMQECTGWEGIGGGGGTCHTSCSIFHNRGETEPCEIALVGRGQEAEEERVIHHAASCTREKKLVERGQEAEEGRFSIIVASINLKQPNKAKL
jgi:hypothetical protein